MRNSRCILLIVSYLDAGFFLRGQFVLHQWNDLIRRWNLQLLIRQTSDLQTKWNDRIERSAAHVGRDEQCRELQHSQSEHTCGSTQDLWSTVTRCNRFETMNSAGNECLKIVRVLRLDLPSQYCHLLITLLLISTDFPDLVDEYEYRNQIIPNRHPWNSDRM